MASIFAARAGAQVRLLESTSTGGRKILISGGGRCNILPSQLSPSDYVTASSPNTLKKILLSWPLAQQRTFFEETLGIRLALEEESGKLFPASNRAQDVREALVSEARAAGVTMHFGTRVRGLAQRPPGWRITTDTGELEAGSVVLATGGLSVPQTGSDGAGFRVTQSLGHTLNATYPALTPLTTQPAVHAPLAGISLKVRISAPPPGGPFATTGGFLFTHRGYSGPSVLNASHLFVLSQMDSYNQALLATWLGDDAPDWPSLLSSGGSGKVLPLIRRYLPDRLAEMIVTDASVDGQRTLSQLRKDERAKLVERLTAYPLPCTGDEGYKKAEVTGGGVPLSEVVPQTLESRMAPGLFLCGELLDAFGPIGGYNFAWAWATGRAAGLGAAAKTRAE